jgi:hypothetical protein
VGMTQLRWMLALSILLELVLAHVRFRPFLHLRLTKHAD